MKKIISLMLVVTIVLSLAIGVNAEDTYLVSVDEDITVLVNGEKITQNTEVSASDKIKLTVEDESIVAINIGGVYYPLGKTFKANADIDLTSAIFCTLGLNMVDGAQVRVGDVELSEEGKLDSTADSGLRFLATADYADTVIADANVEFGIKVTAEGSDTPVYIKADKFQDDKNTVFTAAITNLSESNYNRKYAACAYALVPLHDGTYLELTTATVVRSIYQVSVGILKNSSAELENSLPYTIDDAVREVLAAYVNQTGIRLSYSADGTISARTSGKGAYTGDLYFKVTSAVNGDGGTSVTITPMGDSDGFFNPVEIPTWWQDYIRINNNNSVAVNYISNAKLENGSLSFTFKLPSTVDYTFNQEDNVTIVKQVTADTITGIKGGEDVTYSLADTITIMGLAKSMDDIVPGCVIMVGTNSDGDVAAIELLASLGFPINPTLYESSFGIYTAADGSSKYQNIVTEMFSKSGTKITCHNLPDTTKTVYRFETTSSMCYRVGIAVDNGTPVITAKGNKISTYPSIFENTSLYHNYVYFRYNTESGKVKECVFYCVPKDLDFTGDGEYSEIFSLDDYRIIIQ